LTFYDFESWEKGAGRPPSLTRAAYLYRKKLEEQRERREEVMGADTPAEPAEPRILLPEMPPVTALEREVTAGAACKDYPSSWFVGQRLSPTQAVAVCEQCPVMDKCRQLADYIEADIRPWDEWAGIWGGETKVERFARRHPEAYRRYRESENRRQRKRRERKRAGEEQAAA